MRSRGFTLVEMLVALAIAITILAGIDALLRSALAARDTSGGLIALERDAQFALERMATALGGTTTILVPQSPNGQGRDVLAVLLDPTLDRDGDGYADADNDKNGKVDDDLPADHTNDGAPGIVGIDDDGDGRTDIGTGPTDNDERGTLGSPVVMPRSGADWLDVVLFRLVSGNLLERMPNVNAANGNDFTERVIASNVTAFSVELLATGANRSAEVRVTLTLTAPNGSATLTRTLRLRVGR